MIMTTGKLKAVELTPEEMKAETLFARTAEGVFCKTDSTDSAGCKVRRPKK